MQTCKGDGYWDVSVVGKYFTLEDILLWIWRCVVSFPKWMYNGWKCLPFYINPLSLFCLPITNDLLISMNTINNFSVFHSLDQQAVSRISHRWTDWKDQQTQVARPASCDFERLLLDKTFVNSRLHTIQTRKKIQKIILGQQRNTNQCTPEANSPTP